MKKERVTGKAGINYKRTLDAVFFMVNAFLCGAANARDTQCGVGAEYERKGYERKGYEGAIYGQDMNGQHVEEQEI